MTSAPGVAARRRALVLGVGFSDRDFLHLNPISIWIPTRRIGPEQAPVPLRPMARQRAGARAPV